MTEHMTKRMSRASRSLEVRVTIDEGAEKQKCPRTALGA